MNGQLPGSNALLRAGFPDQLLRQRRTLPTGDHPADGITAEDVQDDVEVEVSPLGWTQQLGDVPRPDLIGTGGQQLWLLVSRVTELVTPFSDLIVLVEDAIHGPDRAKILAFIEQGGIHLSWRLIDKPFGIELSQDGLPLCRPQGARRCRPLRCLHETGGLAKSIQGGARHVQGLTGSYFAHVLGEGERGVPSLLSPFRGIPSASASFFWNSMMISACWSRLESFWFCRFNCSLSATSWLC
jgi:hypothetical protein